MAQTELIEKYLSDAELKEVATEEWRAVCREQFERRTPETIISNAAYEIAYKIVDEHFELPLSEVISQQVAKVISELSDFTVFRSPSTFDRTPSPAWKLLQQVVVEEKDAINKAVRAAASKIDEYDVLRLIQGATMSLKLEAEGS